MRGQCQPATADFRLVHDVVVNQRRQMDHLDNDGDCHVRFAGSA